MRGHWREIPPPAQPSVYPESAALGICEALQSKPVSEYFRCSACEKMVVSGSVAVLVPDLFNFRRPSSESEVLEVCRQQSFNGSFSWWCLDCARRLTAPRLNLQDWLEGKLGEDVSCMVIGFAAAVVIPMILLMLMICLSLLR